MSTRVSSDCGLVRALHSKQPVHQPFNQADFVSVCESVVQTHIVNSLLEQIILHIRASDDAWCKDVRNICVIVSAL